LTRQTRIITMRWLQHSPVVVQEVFKFSWD
jgi:hypothetical protein